MLVGQLKKMQTQLKKPVEYSLDLGENLLPLNALLGKTITLQYLNRIECIQCHRITQKSFQGGYCYPCFRRLQECGVCTIFPEKCKFPEGRCEPNDWVHAHCGQPHIIYLANTAKIKIGITRKTQIPTRWIDQGAVEALPIFEVSNRYQAGTIETAFKAFLSDKTNWHAMLKNEIETCDLVAFRNQLFEKKFIEIKKILEEFKIEDVKLLQSETTAIAYPVMTYPQKVTPFNFDKTHRVEGTLLGIKGQYLILDTGVLNVRKFSGYCVEVSL